MSHFPETELILDRDKRLYHIQLNGEEIADDVILVGDQNRVVEVSKHFTTVEKKTAHREFISHTGFYNGKRITVLSTGIGTDNIDIVLNELDAAVNIDPFKRELRVASRSLNIFRLGTSGGLQPDIPVNSLVCSSHGLGFDGLLNFYSDAETVCEPAISKAFMQHSGWLPKLPYPYCVTANDHLLDLFKGQTITGITATAPGFYGPQGREIRLGAAMPGLNDRLTDFSLNGLRITNFEMETSALYGLGKLLGHRCLTVCVIIANRITKEFTGNYAASVDLLIENCLHKIAAQK